MPFDAHVRGGGGGGDPQHKMIPEIARATMEAVGAAAKMRGLCLECMALQMAGTSMAVFLLQQDAVNMDTREINADLVQRLTQAVMDIAMSEVAIVLDEHKARKG